MISPKAIEAIFRLKIFGGDLSLRELFKEEKPEHFNQKVLEEQEIKLKKELKKQENGV